MRAAPLIAGALVIAAAAMAVVAFTSGDDGAPERAAAPPAPAPAGDVRDGQTVWAEQGCGSCHALTAARSTGRFGPDLGQTLRGMPASYIKESIVAPSKVAAAGYSTGMMPEDYATRITPDDLDALVSFLRESAAE